MSTRRCPICQTVAAPLIDADGRQFCTSCDLQLPPEDITPTPPPAPRRSRPADDADDRPRRPARAVTARREPEPDVEADDRPQGTRGRGGRVVLVAVVLVGAFFLLALFFGFVIWVKTLPVSAPSTKPGWGTQLVPGAGRFGRPDDFDDRFEPAPWGPRAVPTSKW